MLPNSVITGAEVWSPEGPATVLTHTNTHTVYTLMQMPDPLQTYTQTTMYRQHADNTLRQIKRVNRESTKMEMYHKEENKHNYCPTTQWLWNPSIGFLPQASSSVRIHSVSVKVTLPTHLHKCHPTSTTCIFISCHLSHDLIQMNSSSGLYGFYFIYF